MRHSSKTGGVFKLSKVRLTSETPLDQDNGFKIAKVASLDEIVDRVLFVNINSGLESSEVQINHGIQTNSNAEDAYHMARVLFCTYRMYATPHELLLKFIDRSVMCQPIHYRNVVNIWIKNYPEDFEYMIRSDSNCSCEQSNQADKRSWCSTEEYYPNATLGSIARSPSIVSISTHDCEHSGSRLFEILFNPCSYESDIPLESTKRLLCEDELIKEREKHVRISMSNLNRYGSLNSIHDADRRLNRMQQRLLRSGGHPIARSMVLAMDSRFVAKQLNAMDIENIIYLRPYSLLVSTKSDPFMRNIVRNFNLLSRHVVLSILESHNPVAVTLHWIGICSNLKNLKNFNSLKAIIAGLTNESIHRLKKTIWNRLAKVTIDLFKSLASDVDDKDNQSALRKTQLEYLNSADTAIVPYLGTFLTDLNFLNARYPKYKNSVETTKLKKINFEKCSRQYEVIRIIDHFQKKIIDKLISPVPTYENQYISYTKANLLLNRVVPKVSRVFEDWFFSHYVSSVSDKEW